MACLKKKKNQQNYWDSPKKIDAENKNEISSKICTKTYVLPAVTQRITLKTEFLCKVLITRKIIK